MKSSLKKTRSLRWLLLIWLLGILFPMAWLRDFSLAYRRTFDAIFHPLWMHVLVHALLFAGLVIILYAVFPATRRFGRMLALLLLVAVLQEAFQALTAAVFYPGGALFDLVVDLIGGAIGWLGAMAWFKGSR